MMISNYKKYIFIIIILFINTYKCKSDAIFFPSLESGLVTISLESILSFENRVNSRCTFNYWGGFGILYSILPESHVSAKGFEIAFEPRWYLRRDIYNKSSLSVYLGIAYMKRFSKDKYIGLVPGVKYSYKLSYPYKKSILISEPYFGISSPLYTDTNNQYISSDIIRFTIGIRVGINRIYGIN